jgi:hypothetical protein
LHKWKNNFLRTYSFFKTLDCFFTTDYTGNGCETLIDHCAVADKCKNGGTCQTLANGIGFQCQCMPGYSASIHVADDGQLAVAQSLLLVSQLSPL